eukprot:CAMPEP_0175112420 /NCGR_PEP_ID=MMETSP0086_2-20121207/15479_1 /TAXON_ID=136419 /ORGANISM="Unknown Unknown, Strain D1" /LENGTH=243 /DNA_ID=CAMNT_0016391333 /DNA_START=120 /DNA_END=851 /DNA_ORIENTATION=+
MASPQADENAGDLWLENRLAQIKASSNFVTVLCILTVVLLLFLVVAAVFLWQPQESPKSLMKTLHHNHKNPVTGQPCPRPRVLVHGPSASCQSVDSEVDSDCFPLWTGRFPAHWSHYPDFLDSSDASRVVLPGNYGTGSAATALWVGRWLVLDHILQDVSPLNTLDLSPFRGFPVHLVSAAVRIYFSHVDILHRELMDHSEVPAFWTSWAEAGEEEGKELQQAVLLHKKSKEFLDGKIFFLRN